MHKIVPDGGVVHSQMQTATRCKMEKAVLMMMMMMTMMILIYTLNTQIQISRMIGNLHSSSLDIGISSEKSIERYIILMRRA